MTFSIFQDLFQTSPEIGSQLSDFGFDTKSDLLNNHVIPSVESPKSPKELDLDLGLDIADLFGGGVTDPPEGGGYSGEGHPLLPGLSGLDEAKDDLHPGGGKVLGGGDLGLDLDLGGLGDFGGLGDLSSLLGDLGDTHKIVPAPPPKGDGSFEDHLNSIDLGLDAYFRKHPGNGLTRLNIVEIPASGGKNGGLKAVGITCLSQ